VKTKYKTTPEYRDRLLEDYVLRLGSLDHVAAPLLTQKRDELVAEGAGTEERVQRLLDYAGKLGMSWHVNEYLEKVAEIEAVLPATPVRRWIPVPPPQPIEAEEEAVRLLEEDVATRPLQRYLLRLQRSNGKESS
jgi:hypothetical protein